MEYLKERITAMRARMQKLAREDKFYARLSDDEKAVYKESMRLLSEFEDRLLVNYPKK